MSKYVLIYLTQDRKSTQIIRPTKKFDGNWHDLVDTVTSGKYSGYVKKG